MKSTHNNTVIHRTLREHTASELKRLTGLNTRSLRRLSATVENGSASAKETLFCFAAASGKLGYFLDISRSSKYAGNYQRWAAELQKYLCLEEYLSDSHTEKRLQDVYRGYLGQWDLIRSKRRRSSQYAKKINELLPHSGKTRYEICTDLGINLGNFYAYLKGDNTKLTYEKAKMAYEYLLTVT